jgi:hypothetical protein
MQRKNILIAALIILIVGLVIWMLSSNKKTSWDYSYLPESQAPYGTYIFHQLLQNNKRNIPTKIIKNKMPEQLLEHENAVYVHITRNDNYRKDEVEALIDFVRDGNAVFLATPTPSWPLLMHIFLSPEEVLEI